MVQTHWGMEYPSRTLLVQELQGLESTPPALQQVWERESKDSEARQSRIAVLHQQFTRFSSRWVVIVSHSFLANVRHA